MNDNGFYESQFKKKLRESSNTSLSRLKNEIQVIKDYAKAKNLIGERRASMMSSVRVPSANSPTVKIIQSEKHHRIKDREPES